MVLDSTCLIALERIGKLEVLRAVYPRIVVPPAVLAEFGLAPDWIEVREVRNATLVSSLRTQLGEGEAAAISLTTEMEGFAVLLDDKKARRVARRMGLAIVGTIGTLVRAKREGCIGSLAPILRSLRAAGFHLSVALEEEALRLAGEAT